MERQEPVHRLGRRRPHRARARPRRAAAASCSPSGTCCPTSCTPRCCAARSAPRSSRWTPPTGTGSRCGARWRLNERHYGALQGKDKKQTLEEFGEEQFMLWRRSYDTPPPPIGRRRRVVAGRRPALRRRCRDEVLPRTECLKDVVERMLPYWYDAIVPDLRDGQHRAGRRARQLAARPGQAPRRHLRRGHRRAEHPDRHPAASTSWTTTCGRSRPAGEYLDPDAAGGGRSRRSRTRAAERTAQHASSLLRVELVGRAARR